MHPVAKAVWYIEAHLADDMSLSDLSAVAGVSPYHLARSFSALTGLPPMRYVRLRRLSRAAVALAGFRASILLIALEAGYGSHEAFTGAFVTHFGTTPAMVRKSGDLNNLKLAKPVRMTDTPYDTLADPEIVESGSHLIAGLRKRYGPDTAAEIPNQWQAFVPHIGQIPDQAGNAAFGVRYNSDGEGHLDYLTGVEVSSFSDLPCEFENLRLPPQRYAVFAHQGHVSDIRRTWHTIFRDWIPAHNIEIRDAPDFERYADDFDPATGTGRIEIWIPLLP